MEVYLINDTTSTIEISDLHGVNILEDETINILDLYPYEWVTRSLNLKTYVSNGEIIVNDGSKNLSINDALEQLESQTVYEAKHELHQHVGIKTAPPANRNSVIQRDADSTSYIWADYPQAIGDLFGVPEYDLNDPGVLVNDGTDVTWFKYFSHGGGSSVAGGVNFTMSDHASHDFVSNSNDTYVTLRSFIYDGSHKWIPGIFSIIASRVSQLTTGYARIFDVTNSNEIAVITWDGEEKAIYETTILQNIPEESSLFELQTKSLNKGRDINLHFMALY